MTLITEDSVQKTVTRTIKTDGDIQQTIGNFTYSLSDNAPLGNYSNFVVNQDLYIQNKKDFNNLYKVFVTEMITESEE